MFSAKILADSVNTSGNRLTTFELTYPRFVHSELLTHRMFSRNSASSRAIPVEKMLQRIKDNPVVPIHLGKNQPGMQAETEVDEHTRTRAIAEWLLARDNAVTSAEWLLEMGIHKQIVNRLVEPFMWITVIVSSTNYRHWFGLRDHPAAEPHIRHLAGMMREVYNASTPVLKHPEQWHLPLIGFPGDEEIPDYHKPLVSAGRCARVSYLTHHGTRDVQADIDLATRLASAKPMHASPLEHPACALHYPARIGNFVGWRQLRKTFTGEYLKENSER